MPLPFSGVVTIVPNGKDGCDVVASQRVGSARLGAALEPLLGSTYARSLRSLRIDVLSFVERSFEHKTTKPATFHALTELGAMLENADLPELRELVVGPLFVEALPTKPAPAPLRLHRAPRLRPRSDHFLQVFSEAWLEILDATAEAASFGHTKGRTLPLSVATMLDLRGRLLQRAWTGHAESPEELAGRPWKVERYPDAYDSYALVYWGPGWKIRRADAVNGARMDEPDVHLVPGDVVTSPRGELTLKLCAR